jgi:hypothetical protein
VLHGITGEAVAQAEVAFLMPGEDGQLSEVVRQRADAEGSFAFTGPFLQPGLSFVLVAFYRDVPYPTQTLTVGQQSAVLIEVYEPTEDDGDLYVTGYHHFLSVDAGGVDATQLVHVDNRGERTFVGHDSGHDRHVTEFILPAGLVGLESHGSDLHRVGASWFDTQPLPPGGTQIAFSFRLPVSAFEGEYRHQVRYPTDAVDFYVQPPSVQPGPPFEDLGEVDVQGRRYRRLRIRNPELGDTLHLPLPLSRPARWMVKWALLALGAVAGVAVLLVGARRGGATDSGGAAPATDLEARRQDLLDELARLDEAGGDASRREALLREAVAVYRALERGR